MSEELKAFFNKIKDSQDYFLLWRLYNNPGSVIGNKQDMDEAEEEYYNLYDYYRLMMNNNLTEFIDLIRCDDNFLGKDDIQTWRKLGFFLYDSIDFKKYYYMLDDPDVLLALNDKIPIQEYIKRKKESNSHPKFPLFEMYEAYKKYEKLFKHNYPREQIDNYDEKQAAHVRWYVKLRLSIIKAKTIDKEENKRIALKWIEDDDYSDGSDFDNAYLYRYQLLKNSSYRAFDDLVCENRFLDIIEHKLDEGKIDGVPLDNALDIIIMGINIKKGNINNLELLVERLGIDLIRDFDWHRAEELVSRITLYRIQKRKHQGVILQLHKK